MRGDVRPESDCCGREPERAEGREISCFVGAAQVQSQYLTRINCVNSGAKWSHQHVDHGSCRHGKP